MGDNRNIVYYEFDTGKWVYRASGLGNCIGALSAARMGHDPAPPPDFLLKAFNEGSRNEPVVLRLLTNPETAGGLGVNLWDDKALELLGLVVDVPGDDDLGIPPSRQLELEFNIPGVLPHGVVRMHTDGMATIYKTVPEKHKKMGFVPGMKCVVEVKALGPDYWKKWQRSGFEGLTLYHTQISCLMIASGLPVLFVVGRKDEEGVVQEIEYELIKKIPVPRGKLIAKVLKVERHGAEQGWGGELLPCDNKTFPCPYYRISECGDRKEKELVEDSSKLVMEGSTRPAIVELEAMVKELYDLTPEIEAARQVMKKEKEAKDKIKKWFKDHDKDEGSVVVPGLKAGVTDGTLYGRTIEFEGGLTVKVVLTDVKGYTVKDFVKTGITVKRLETGKDDDE